MSARKPVQAVAHLEPLSDMKVIACALESIDESLREVVKILSHEKVLKDFATDVVTSSDLTIKPYNVLLNHKLYTWRQVSGCEERYLRNFGRNAAREVGEQLAKRGLPLPRFVHRLLRPAERLQLQHPRDSQ